MESGWLARPIKAVLLDITGVLYESGNNHAIAGSIDAIKKLRSAGLPFRLVTNETQNPVQHLVTKLNRFGYDFEPSEVIAPAPTVRRYLEKHGLRPYLLVHARLLPEFEGLPCDNPNCVVVGDAAEYFTYEAVNGAFQLLVSLKDRDAHGPAENRLSDIERASLLISMGKNKYYKENGSLVIDLGAYTTALEFAADVKSIVIGKPSPNYFGAALQTFETEYSPDEVVMVGDDIMGDVKGSQDMGMRGVLVRTGKFRPSDENHPTVKPSAIVANLSEAIDQILQARNAPK